MHNEDPVPQSHVTLLVFKATLNNKPPAHSLDVIRRVHISQVRVYYTKTEEMGYHKTDVSQ